MARPTDFTQDLADAICARLAEGESLRSIGRDESMPVASTVHRWVQKNDAFCEQYTRARELQADTLADETLDIADDGQNDWMERNAPGNAGYEFNGEAVARSRLRVDTRKWAAGKLNPKKYSDKLQIAGDDKNPIAHRVEVTFRHAGPGDNHPAAVGAADTDT